MANYGDLSLDQAILQLILQHEVPDQASLLRLLAEDGFKLTQGTLSRRLAKLNVEKRKGRYQRVIPEDHPFPAYAVVDSPPNLLVLQTGPGLGMALAIRVDRSSVPGIAGTIAGEDTLLVIAAKGATLEELKGRLAEVLGPPEA